MLRPFDLVNIRNGAFAVPRGWYWKMKVNQWLSMVSIYVYITHSHFAHDTTMKEGGTYPIKDTFS